MGLLLAAALVFNARPCRAAGVTLITHGFDSDANGWVTGMGEAIARYPRMAGRFGSSIPLYKIYFDDSGLFHSQKLNSASPSNNPSGEIILLLDWSVYAGSVFPPSGGQSTEAVGPEVARHLMATNLLPDLQLPVTTFPIHLIGHSRGGSMVAQIAQELGREGVVVDHLTLMDPHPLNNDGNDDFPLSVQDGSVVQGVSDNVLFCDSMYQTLGDGTFVPDGVFVPNSYVRSLNATHIDQGGYDNAHSDAHLWYHGTIDFTQPAASDTEAALDAATRQSWYYTPEDEGALAGFYYSRIGGGDRAAATPKLTASDGFPIQGLNGLWATALGINPATNRTTLSGVTSALPNLIDAQLAGTPDTSYVTNAVAGAPLPFENFTPSTRQGELQLVYKWNGPGKAALRIFLDTNQNWLDGYTDATETALRASGNQPSSVALPLSSILPAGKTGVFYMGLELSAMGFSRVMYLDQVIVLAPDLTIQGSVDTGAAPPAFKLTLTGPINSEYEVEYSADLSQWSPLFQGQLSTAVAAALTGTDSRNGVQAPSTSPNVFLRARLLP